MSINILFSEYKELYKDTNKLDLRNAPKTQLLLLVLSLVLIGLAMLLLQVTKSIVWYSCSMGAAIIILLLFGFFETRPKRIEERKKHREVESKLHLRGVITLLYNSQIDYKNDDEIDTVIRLLDSEKKRVDPFRGIRKKEKYVIAGIVVPAAMAIFECILAFSSKTTLDIEQLIANGNYSKSEAIEISTEVLSNNLVDRVFIVVVIMIAILVCYIMWYILAWPLIESIYFSDKKMYECFCDDLYQLKTFHKANKTDELREDLIPDNKEKMKVRREEIETELKKINRILQREETK